jgi:hypothetical protein
MEYHVGSLKSDEDRLALYVCIGRKDYQYCSITMIGRIVAPSFLSSSLCD